VPSAEASSIRCPSTAAPAIGLIGGRLSGPKHIPPDGTLAAHGDDREE
jgi:hypothetical protein